MRTDEQGAAHATVGAPLELEAGGQYTLVVYKHGKRAAVGDWLALVPRDLALPCQEAPLVGNAFRITADWHAGPFAPQQAGEYDLCWAAAGPEGDLGQDEVRQTTPPVSTAPAQNDVAKGRTNWYQQPGVAGAVIKIGVTGPKDGGGADLERRRLLENNKPPSLEQQYAAFIGRPAAHRILRPIYQHAIEPRPAAAPAASFVEER